MKTMEREWVWSLEHERACRIIKAQTLWDETTGRVWQFGRHFVARILASRLKFLESAGIGSADDIAYVVAAARVADIMSRPPYTRKWDPPPLNDE